MASAAARFGSSVHAHMQAIQRPTQGLIGHSVSGVNLPTVPALPKVWLAKPSRETELRRRHLHPDGRFIEDCAHGWPLINTSRLHPHDWTTLALEWHKMYPEPYGYVMTIPPGGQLFAEALVAHINVRSTRLLLVIDRVTSLLAINSFLLEESLTPMVDGFVIATAYMYEGFRRPVDLAAVERSIRPVFRVPRGGLRHMVNADPDDLGPAPEPIDPF